MNRRWTAAAIGAAALVALLLVFWATCRGPAVAPETPNPTPTPAAVNDEETTEVRLLFPGRDDRLHVELRELPLRGSPEANAAAILSTLLAGPLDETLLAPLPPGATVDGVRLGDDGLAYLLLRSEGEPPGSGSDEERLRIYSLVNTLVANQPSVDRVALVWNDVQRPALGGHLDTGRPLAADPSLESP